VCSGILRLMLRSALCGCAFGGVLLAASVVHAQCTKDTDCKGERVCDAGVCTAPAAPAPDPNGWGVSADAPEAAESPAAASPAAAVRKPPSASASPRELQPSIAASDESPPKPKMERNSTGMMAAGIVMVSISPIPLIAGLLYSAHATVCRGSDAAIGDDDYDPDCSHYNTAAIVYTFTSLALLGAGVPMIVIGGKRVPAKQPWQAAVVPYATPSGAGVSLRLEL
jgi:hypothetical protein